MTKSEDSSWVIGNLKHAGFYRVNYDEKNWNMLIEQLKNDFNVLDASSRAQLIDDSFNLGRAELIDQTKFLELVSYLAKETDSLPFVPAVEGLAYFESMLVDKFETFEMFKVSFL